MATKTRRKYINMMLAKSYCDDWTIREVLREVVSNAIDADPDYTIQFDSEVLVTTTTSPSLSNIMMMGSGTKNKTDESIGMFNEGLKISALACTRLKLNMQIETPHGLITFVFRHPDGFDEECLHACLDVNTKYEGCRISFSNNGSMKAEYREMFIKGSIGPQPLNKEGSCRIYSKNVLVCDLSERSLFDWNLDKLELNRDRTIPNQHSLKSLIGYWILEKSTTDILDRIMEDNGCFEIQCIKVCWMSTSSQDKLRKSFHRVYGDNAVIASGNQHNNTIAAYKGHNVIAISDGLAEALNNVVDSVDKVLTTEDTYITKKLPEGSSTEALRRIANILGCTANVVVFEKKDNGLGYFDPETGNIGLSEELFVLGAQQQLLETYLHEVGHWMSSSTDATIAFEAAQSKIAGILANQLINQNTNQ